MKKINIVIILIIFILTACEKRGDSTNLQGALTISEIQGCSHESPYNGQRVEDVVGIVTAKVYNGFYLQSEVADGVDCTSDAIFVFTKDFPKVIPGDKVRVNGTIDEFSPGGSGQQNLTITEIINPEVHTISSGNQLPAVLVIGQNGRNIPTQIIDNDSFRKFDPEEDGIDFFESLESMLVSLPNGVVVGARNSFNEIVIIQPELLDSNIVSESGVVIQTEDDPNPERIILNLNKENKTRVNTGSELTEQITGVMDYSYGNYKIRVFGLANTTEKPFSAQVFSKNEDDITIVTYNVENLALQDDASKFQRLASEIVNKMDTPDIILLHEVMDDSGIEDDGTVTAEKTVARLVDMIIKKGGPRYEYSGIDPENNRDGGAPGGNIRSLILYRSDTGISLVKKTNNLKMVSNPMKLGEDDWQFRSTRKPLVALFEREGRQFLVTSAHLTSRRLDSPLFGNKQPIERLEENKRIVQASLIYKFLDEFNQAYPEIPIIIAGDLNDDSWSATIKTLQGRLFHNANLSLPENERYSYVYEGNAIQIDHILISNPEIVTRFVILHLNSVFDHMLQMSDHDPVLISIRLPR